MQPIPLSANQPPARFYRGGAGIAQFRGDGQWQPNTPEDWVASTTSVRGHAPTGMTRLDDGRLLAEAIADDPIGWLGEPHVARYGADTMLLVKLLDAGQRLPVHAHPDGQFAATHVSAAHGKAEAWYILTPGTVHLGLKRSVGADELRTLVATQNTTALLSLMHEVEVEAGDCVFVPHGLLHAIGAGILLAEVQEPEDLSILLEWHGFDLDGEADGHLGLGFELALTAVETEARPDAAIEALIKRRVTQGDALPAESSEFFRLDRVGGDEPYEAGFSVVIALEQSELSLAAGPRRDLAPGSTTLIPCGAGEFSIAGAALLARPPRP